MQEKFYEGEEDDRNALNDETEDDRMDRRIAYLRVPLKDILLHNENKSRCPMWIPLKNIPRNSKSVGGNLYNSMYNIFQNGSILVNIEKSYNIQLGLNRRKHLVSMDYELRCYIYACRNVISNFPISPNTFVHISCNGKMKITSLVLNSSNPVFLQCLKLNVSILTDYSLGIPTIPLIVVTLYELYNNTFYFIGRCYCNYDTYLKDNRRNRCNFKNKCYTYNVVEQIKPRWVKLKGKKHVRAMYEKNIWQQYGYEKRVLNENMYEKQKEFTSRDINKENKSYGGLDRQSIFHYNNILKGDRVGDILVYFELVKTEDSVKAPIFPMITEIRKCSLTFCCMTLENLILIKKNNFLKHLYNNPIERINITHPIVMLSVTSYSSYGKQQNEFFVKYQKSLKTDQKIQLKKWKNSFNQQSFEMFSIDNMEIDIPLDPIFDPMLNIKVYNKKVKQKNFIGETSIPLVPYFPWIQDIEQVLTYLQAYDDYSETMNFQNIDTVMNLCQNKNATLIISAISLADMKNTIALKEEVARNENKNSDDERKYDDKSQNEDKEQMENNENADIWNKLLIFKEQHNRNEKFRKTYPYGIKDRNYHLNPMQWHNRLIQNKNMSPYDTVIPNSTLHNGYNLTLQNVHLKENDMYRKNEYIPNVPKQTVHHIKYQENVYKLHDDGVPEIVKITYNIKDYPYLKILINAFILNVYIPPRFILYVEGNKINIKRLLKNSNGGSVDGMLENYLDDVLLPSIPLKKKYNTFDIDEESVETKVEKEGVSFGCFEKFPFIELEGGFIKCFTKLKYQKYVSDHIPPSLQNIDKPQTFRDQFRGDKKIPRYLKVRVYVLRGIGICGVNENKSANPYLIFSLGEKTSNLRNSFKKSDMNPEFCSLWESEAIFPENEILTISVYSAEDNYNNETDDIYIGSTEIHLLDRWLSKEWRYMMKRNKIPIEYRPLYNNITKEIGNYSNLNKGKSIYKSIFRYINDNFNFWQNIICYFFNSNNMKGTNYNIIGSNSCNKQSLPQNNNRNNYGILEMWVKIMSYEEAKKMPFHKVPPPKETEIEIRIIIWRCTILLNEINGTVPKKSIDLVIKSELDCSKYKGKNPTTQSTDVHYNCKTGNAIFNWRVVYPQVTHPINTCFLQIAAYNNNNIGVNNFLGEVNLELSRYIHKVSQTMDSIEVDAELKLRKKKYIDEEENTCNGYIQLTAQFLPQQKADFKPVGLGRNEPNRNPYLRTPDSGREWEDFISSIGLNNIYKPFRSWLKLFFISLLLIWLFILSFVYPALLM